LGIEPGYVSILTDCRLWRLRSAERPLPDSSNSHFRPRAAGRADRSAMAGRVQQPLATTTHRQVIGQSCLSGWTERGTGIARIADVGRQDHQNDGLHKPPMTASDPEAPSKSFKLQREIRLEKTLGTATRGQHRGPSNSSSTPIAPPKAQGTEVVIPSASDNPDIAESVGPRDEIAVSKPHMDYDATDAAPRNGCVPCQLSLSPRR
jgi:hypothetical protein